MKRKRNRTKCTDEHSENITRSLPSFIFSFTCLLSFVHAIFIVFIVCHSQTANHFQRTNLELASLSVDRAITIITYSNNLQRRKGQIYIYILYIISWEKNYCTKVIAVIDNLFFFLLSYFCFFFCLFSLGTKTTSNDCQYRAQKSSFSTTVSQHQDSKLYIYIILKRDRMVTRLAR